jgi:hypothetical protein
MKPLTDAEISAAIDRNPEIYALWQKAIEIARRPAPPKPEPKKTLVELRGNIAEKAAANPSGVRVKVLDSEGVTTVGFAGRTVDGWHEVRVLDAPVASPTGRPEYPNYFRDPKAAGGATQVYNPIDRLKGE